MSLTRAFASAFDSQCSILPPHWVSRSLKWSLLEQSSRLSWKNDAASYCPGRPMRLLASLSSVILTTAPTEETCSLRLAATACGSFDVADAGLVGAASVVDVVEVGASAAGGALEASADRDAASGDPPSWLELPHATSGAETRRADRTVAVAASRDMRATIGRCRDGERDCRLRIHPQYLRRGLREPGRSRRWLPRPGAVTAENVQPGAAPSPGSSKAK